MSLGFTSPTASPMPTQPPAVHRQQSFYWSPFDCIVWWNQKAREPPMYITPEQQQVIDACEFLSAIQRYSQRIEYADFYDSERLQRQFGHSCSHGCSCETQPIGHLADLQQVLEFKINSSNDEDDDTDIYDPINTPIIIMDEDGNLYEPETDTQPDESPTHGS